MKKVLFVFTALLFFCSFLSLTTACSDDDENIEEKQNDVVYVINTSDNQALLIVDGCGETTAFKQRGPMRKEVKTKAHYARMEVQCSDNYVIITCQIYVNGKLKMERSDRGYILMQLPLKC